jgi:hypothetical protein
MDIWWSKDAQSFSNMKCFCNRLVRILDRAQRTVFYHMYNSIIYISDISWLENNSFLSSISIATRTECIVPVYPLKMTLIQLVILRGIVGNTLVMNDVFILNYINHKLEKTSRETNWHQGSGLWVTEGTKNKRKRNSPNSPEHRQADGRVDTIVGINVILYRSWSNVGRR